MPKKTKKQKLLAQHHRYISLSLPASPQLVKTQLKTDKKSPETESIPLFSFKSQAVRETQTHEIKADYTYVKHDLIRITIFTISALIVQGMLYFVLKKG